MLETERLILRQWEERDRAPWRALNADPDVMAHFPAVLYAAEADRQLDFCRDVIAGGGTAFWAVERADDGLFLGFAGLNCIGHDIALKGAWEVGWRLARHAWGHGYASEAGRAALAHGFGAMGLERILSYTASTNLPSEAVMQRIGMERSADFDFDHPLLPEGHPLRRHIVYAKAG